MLETATRLVKSNPNLMGFLPHKEFSKRTVNRMEWGTLSRDARLLDASIAGVVLSFNPRDAEMREKATVAWDAVRADLADHVFTQEATLPWRGDASVGSPTASELIKKR